jgi:hypothetical protein
MCFLLYTTGCFSNNNISLQPSTLYYLIIRNECIESFLSPHFVSRDAASKILSACIEAENVKIDCIKNKKSSSDYYTALNNLYKVYGELSCRLDINSKDILNDLKQKIIVRNSLDDITAYNTLMNKNIPYHIVDFTQLRKNTKELLPTQW